MVLYGDERDPYFGQDGYFWKKAGLPVMEDKVHFSPADASIVCRPYRGWPTRHLGVVTGRLEFHDGSVGVLVQYGGGQSEETKPGELVCNRRIDFSTIAKKIRPQDSSS